MLTSKPKRLLFRPVLRRRWKWTFSLLLRETEASRHKREEEDVGVKDSPSKRAKTVEEPAYPPSVPATTPTPGRIEAQAHPLSPSNGERSLTINGQWSSCTRDRENAKMMVARLPAGTTAEDLNKPFKDASDLIRGKSRQ